MKPKTIRSFGVVLILTLLAGCQGATTPTTGTGEPSLYKVVINVTAQAETYVNAYVCDASGSAVVNSTIAIDGTSLPVMSDSTIHWANLKTTWAEGSTHTYSVTTADGKAVSGTMVKPVGTVAGVTYGPSRTNAIANEYAVSPPPGNPSPSRPGTRAQTPTLGWLVPGRRG